jgi:two-component system, chemotaxis family, chemotaxis protein CheV
MKAKDGILLESGTNEVEILEFVLGGQGFGVNVLKVQAIEQFDPGRVTEVQLAHPAVVGSYRYRDRVITLVNLGKELQIHERNEDVLDPAETAAIDTVLSAMPQIECSGSQVNTAASDDAPGQGDRDTTPRIVLVLEFNEQTTGFLVDGVNRIHRISWDAISPLSPYLAEVQSKFTGSLNVDGREILIVDMERILADILPTTQRDLAGEAFTDQDLRQRRSRVVLMLAEDSVTIRNLLTAEFKRAGYEQLSSYDNGMSCLKSMQDICEKTRAEGGDPGTRIGAVVSDIEMPQLDGMTLCRRIKSDLGLNNLPVILFSSLINEQIARKCEAVGADAYLSKPRFKELIEVIDRHVFDR